MLKATWKRPLLPSLHVVPNKMPLYLHNKCVQSMKSSGLNPLLQLIMHVPKDKKKEYVLNPLILNTNYADGVYIRQLLGILE